MGKSNPIIRHVEASGYSPKDARELFIWVCNNVLGIPNPNIYTILKIKEGELVPMIKVLEFFKLYKLQIGIRVYWQDRRNQDSRKRTNEKFEDLF